MDDIRRYVEDIETIRRLMTRYEEQAIIKHWAFYLWGLLVAAGSTINYVLFRSIGLGGLDAVLRIWVPVLLIGSLGEILGWLMNAHENGMALFTRRSRRILAGYLGVAVVLLMVVIDGAPSGIHAGTLLAIGSVPLLLYAQVSFGALFTEGFVLLALALVLRMFSGHAAELRLVVGVFCGISYAVAGVHSYVLATRTGGGGE